MFTSFNANESIDDISVILLWINIILNDQNATPSSLLNSLILTS